MFRHMSMSDCDDAFSHVNGKFSDVIYPEMEKLITQNLACRLKLPL